MLESSKNLKNPSTRSLERKSSPLLSKKMSESDFRAIRTQRARSKDNQFAFLSKSSSSEERSFTKMTKAVSKRTFLSTQ
jgi:hypothetical protein